MIRSKEFNLASGKNTLPGQRGAILIWLIFTIIAISGIGTSMVFLTASSTNDEMLANNQERAYFIAESGGRLAIPQIQEDPAAAVTNLNDHTFTLSGGEKFTLEVDIIDSSLTRVVSTGIVNEGSFLEGKRVVTYNIESMSFDSPFDDEDDFDTNWSIDSGKADIKSGGPEDNESALVLQAENDDDKETIVSINWDGNPNLPDIAAARSQNGGLLSYQIQVKLKLDAQGSKGEHFIEGLSFRLDVASTDPIVSSFYGISFFHSEGCDSTGIPWIDNICNDPGNSFLPIMGDEGDEGDEDVYIILWKKEDSLLTLLAYKLLVPDDPVFGNPPFGEEGGQKEFFKNWSTIVVQIFEVFQADGVTRENRISAYFQGPDTSGNPPSVAYPRNTINWNFSNFVPIVWDTTGTSDPIVDLTFTTENFETVRPAEIGIHGFYDSNANQDQIFDDFALKLINSNGSGIVNAIQF